MYWDWGWTGWAAIAAIATGVLAIGVFVGFWRAKKQLEVTRDSTNAQLAVELFRELRSHDALQIIRFIYGLEPEEKVENLSTIDKYNIDYLLDRLDLLGALVNRGIIDSPLAIEGFGGPAVLRCWFQLVHYIKSNQKKRGYYVENYEAFARLSLDYFHGKDIKICFYQEGREKKELVFEELQKDGLRPRNLKEIRRDRLD